MKISIPSFLLAITVLLSVSYFSQAQEQSSYWDFNADGTYVTFLKDEHTLSRAEQAYAMLVGALPEQRRRKIILDPGLCAYARGISEDMAIRGGYGHVNPEGISNNVPSQSWENIGSWGEIVNEPFTPLMDWVVPEFIRKNYYDLFWFGHTNSSSYGDMVNPLLFLTSLPHGIVVIGLPFEGRSTANAIYMGIGLVTFYEQWSLTYNDWPYTADGLFDRTQKNAHYGTIVVQFAEQPMTADNIPALYTADGVPVTPDMDWIEIGTAADIMDRAGDIEARLAGDRNGSETVFETQEYNPGGLVPFTRNEDNSLQSPWLGKFVDVGGGFLWSKALGLIYSHQDNGKMFVFDELQETPKSFYKMERITGDNIINSSVDELGIIKQTDWTHKQGYHMKTDKGWVWMHPRFGANARLQNGDWVPAEGIKQEDADYAYLEVSSWQAYAGDSVLGAWATDRSGVKITITGGQEYDHGLGVSAVTLPNPGQYEIRMTTPGHDDLAKQIVVHARPNDPQISMTASHQVTVDNTDTPEVGDTKVVSESNPDLITVALGEVFTIDWSTSGGVPIVESNDQGIWSNDTSGSAQFSKSIPGVYTYQIRLGDAVKKLYVRVDGNLFTEE